MVDIFGLGGFVITASQYFIEIEEKKQAKLMDELADNEDFNMVEYREKLDLLREKLNRELPPTVKEQTLKSFVDESGFTGNSSILLDKIKNIIENTPDLLKGMENLKEWNTTSEIIKNSREIIHIIGDLINEIVITFKNNDENIDVYSDSEIADAVSIYLEGNLKYNKVIEVFDKGAFKIISYIQIVLIRKIIEGLNIENV